MALRQCARKAAGVLGLRPASLIAQQQVAQAQSVFLRAYASSEMPVMISGFSASHAATGWPRVAWLIDLVSPAADSSAKYLESHEYAKIDGDIATVGISDHAQVSPSARLQGRKQQVLWSLAAVPSAASGQHAAHQAPVKVMTVSHDCPALPTGPAVLSSNPCCNCGAICSAL